MTSRTLGGRSIHRATRTHGEKLIELSSRASVLNAVLLLVVSSSIPVPQLS